jgi:uncharacterized protein (TIGR03435 family)
MPGTFFRSTRAASGAVGILLCFGSPLSLKAQPGDQFEAATVRKIDTERTPFPTLDINAAYLVAPGASLRHLIAQAFGIEDYQLQGATGWMELESYAINAAAGKPVDKAEMVAMLRRLLAERFQLRVHHETKTVPVFALVVDKGGHKLTPLGQPEKLMSGVQSGEQVALVIGNSIQDLVRHLNKRKGEAALGKPVVDRTGLNGLYRIRLTYFVSRNPDGIGGKLEINFHSALVKELGLRLEPTKAPIQMLVIDSAEKPKANAPD